MDLQEFFRKTRDQQVEIISNTGENIAVRIAPQLRIELYYLDNLFAELCYNRMTNKLVQINAFRNTDLLEPYLIQITLPTA